MVTTNDLIDIWRICHPDKKQFSWSQRKPLIGRRLDFWLICGEIQDNSTITKIILVVKSYYSTVTLTLKRPYEQPFGPCYWKFNPDLLDDPSDVDLIHIMNGLVNRPFPSSPQPPFQSEAKCEVFVMKISFHSY